MRRAVLALVLAAACAAASGAGTERRYELAGHGFLRLTMPEGWLDEIREPPAPAPPTIAFRPLEGERFLVLVTPLWPPRPDVPLPGREAMRERAQRSIERVRPRAVEQDIALNEFAGASGPGFYYSATDRAPKAGEFLYLTQGMVRVDRLIVTFTVLSNAAGEREALRAATLGMLRSAAQLPQ